MLWGFTSICNSSSKGSDTIFWPLWICTHVMHKHICRQNTYICKVIKYWEPVTPRCWIGGGARSSGCRINKEGYRPWLHCFRIGHVWGCFGAGQMAHRLRVFAALPENQRLVPNIHAGQLTRHVTPVPEDQLSSSKRWHVHIHTYETHTHRDKHKN